MAAFVAAFVASFSAAFLAAFVAAFMVAVSQGMFLLHKFGHQYQFTNNFSAEREGILI